MKPSFYLSLLGILGCHTALAFPSHLSDALAGVGLQNTGRAAPGCPFTKSKRQLPGVTPPFDAELQQVSIQGEHKFVPPSASDKRGPCPGLNAMANHGYLPHNGIGTITDFIAGCQEAFGMGVDLGALLAVYGAIFDGDLTKYSIGGPSPSLPILGDLLGQPQGLSGSHNKYESDNSPVRGDLYQYGNNDVQISQFKTLYEMGQANGDSIDLDVLTRFRVQRWDYSVHNNPYFFSGAFSGVIVSAAAYSFIYRFMANKTAEDPMGVLDGETLKAFYGISGEYPNFSYTPGHERFPDNWYKRHPVDDYTIPYFALDALSMQLEHPQFLSIGGNTGQTDTFVGVDPADLTEGLFNAGTLLEGNNAFCYAMQVALQMAPDILGGLLDDITGAIAQLSAAVGDALAGLSCPQLDGIDDRLLQQFPGFTELKKSGAY